MSLVESLSEATEDVNVSYNLAILVRPRQALQVEVDPTNDLEVVLEEGLILQVLEDCFVQIACSSFTAQITVLYIIV